MSVEYFHEVKRKLDEMSDDDYLKLLLNAGLQLFTDHYKGYVAEIKYSREDNVFHGKIDCISDLVTIEGNSVEDFCKNFHIAVDDYLIVCEEIGKEPDMQM